ncbi:MAG: hypothetical protein IPK99_12665 [Flavobacteriales bacterium]|nr:hypothetical protein [Flavobacteriales bacterium]
MIRLGHIGALLLVLVRLCQAQEIEIICGTRTPGFYINNKFFAGSVIKSLGSDSLPYLSETERSVMRAFPRGASRKRARSIGPHDRITFIDGATGREVDKRMFFEILRAQGTDDHVSVHTVEARTILALERAPTPWPTFDVVLASVLGKD